MTPKTGGKQATILDMFQPDKTNFKIHCDKPETNESAADVREEQQIELKSVEVQTKLVSVKNKNDDSDNMTWTIARNFLPDLLFFARPFMIIFCVYLCQWNLLWQNVTKIITYI